MVSKPLLEWFGMKALSFVHSKGDLVKDDKDMKDFVDGKIVV